MIQHLWTEKADFCRAELFRSNEQVTDLLERESGAMRDIAEQYRADMRPVRENLIHAVTEVMQGRERLTETLQSLVAVGAASRSEVDQRVEQLSGMVGGDLGSMRRSAEIKETFLVKRPIQAMAQRPQLLGPLDLYRDPKNIFHRANPEPRCSLTSESVQAGSDIEETP
jgi:hypothetical protein